MTQKKVVHLIAGARPNFMKIAPLWHVLNDVSWCLPKIVHTGQHSDINMSDWFFKDLGLPEPHYNLNAQTGSHARVTGSVMMAYEVLIGENRPDLTIVVGDVDSTIACSLSAKKMGVPVAHLEAGLRSFDRTMPEEINRILVDSIADVLWTPSNDGDENLKNEGVAPDRIQLVGNIMIDSLVRLMPEIEAFDIASVLERPLDESYGVVTLHRPANVDNEKMLGEIVSNLVDIARDFELVFPVHPRTKKNLLAFGLWDELQASNIQLLAPLSYIAFNALVKKANFLVTDSGGVQEETTFMNVPCLTMRPNTERPVTITQGTNRLISVQELKNAVDEVLSGPGDLKPTDGIKFWDGQTACRIEERLRAYFGC